MIRSDKRGARVIKDQLGFFIDKARDPMQHHIWVDIAHALSYIALAERGTVQLTKSGVGAVLHAFISLGDTDLTIASLRLLGNMLLGRSVKVSSLNYAVNK